MPMGQLTDEELSEYEQLKARDAETQARDAEAQARANAPAPPANALTEDEIAEYRALRAAQAVREKEAADAQPPPPTHTLVLADGRVVQSAGTMTHYQDVPVLSSVEYVKDAK